MNFGSIIKNFLLTILLLLQFCATSQELFRQRVDHHLSVKLDDSRHVLTGKDSVLYHNQSTKALDEIFYHVWPNACTKGSLLYHQMLENGEDAFHFAEEAKNSSLTGLIIRVNSKPVRWKTLPEHPDIIRIELSKPLQPLSCDTITLMFRISIPDKECTGLSHYETAYLLSNWYPKPAVYDSNGWQLDPLQISGAGLSEFGSLEVALTVPRNYVVAASGLLVENPDETKWLEGIEEKTRRINRWGKRTTAGFPASSPKMKTLLFRNEYANDIVFCLDKRFHHLRDTLKLTGRDQPIDIHLYFTPIEAAYWSNSMDMVKDVLRGFALETGSSQFNQVTIAQAAWQEKSGAGPGFVYLGSVMVPFVMEYQINLQLARHYFSSIVPFNKLKYPWIVNGLGSYYTSHFLEQRYADSITIHDILLDPEAKGNLAGLNNIPLYRTDHLLMGWHLNDDRLPLSLSSDHYAISTLEGITGLKSGLAFQTLFGYLGEGKTRDLMREFAKEWNHGFPSSTDFKKKLMDSTGDSLDWFFNRFMLSGTGFVDYRLKKVERTPHGYILSVENLSDIPAPYTLSSVYQSDERMTWHPGHTGIKEIEITDTARTIKKWVIDQKYLLPEIKKQNNTIRSKGILKKVEPLRFYPIVAAPNPDYTILMGSPVVGWNGIDGLLGGVALYSNPVIPPPSEFLLMPLYGFGSRNLNGVASFKHHFQYNSGMFNKIVVGLNARLFGWSNSPLPSVYHRWMPYVDLYLNKPDARKKYTNRLSIRAVVLSDNQPFYNPEDGSLVKGEWTRRVVNEISWRYHPGHAINSFHSTVRLQQTEKMARILMDGNWFLNYNSRDKGFAIRGFGGLLLTPYDDKSPIGFNITSAGILMNTKTHYLPADPMLDYLYLNRTNPSGLLRQHFYIVDGGFKRVTTVGNTTRWMLAANFTTTIPGRLPLQLYLDAGIFADDATSTYFKGLFLFDSGAKISLIRNVAEIYIPFTFFESKIIGEREELNNPIGYLKKIRFTLNLPLLNPLELSKKIKF